MKEVDSPISFLGDSRIESTERLLSSLIRMSELFDAVSHTRNVVRFVEQIVGFVDTCHCGSGYVPSARVLLADALGQTRPQTDGV